MINIALFGARGRMGCEISRIVAGESNFSDFRIVYSITGPSKEKVAAAADGSTLTSTPERIDSGVDVIVDFSNAAGCRAAMTLAHRLKQPALIATTGLSEADEASVRELAAVVPVVRATNTSIVVTAMLELVAQATALLGPSFDVELVELHHRMKKDAPSGTALSLVEEVATARSVGMNEVLHLGRAGTEALRTKGEVGAYGVRGGDVAGEHTVYFLGDGERLEITQRATTRAVFARGALTAARWLRGYNSNGTQSAPPAPGLYSMKDVLRGSR